MPFRDSAQAALTCRKSKVLGVSAPSSAGPGPLDDGLPDLKCLAGDAAPPHDGPVGGDVREFWRWANPIEDVGDVPARSGCHKRGGSSSSNHGRSSSSSGGNMNSSSSSCRK